MQVPKIVNNFIGKIFVFFDLFSFSTNCTKLFPIS